MTQADLWMWVGGAIALIVAYKMAVR